MRRIRRVLFCILLLGFAVAGCGGDGSGAAGSSSNEEDFYLTVPIPSGVSYEITKGFNDFERDPITGVETEQHKAIDFELLTGTPIIAAAPGVVFEVEVLEEGQGMYILIQHAGTFLTAYAHLGSAQVAVGQEVSRGQTIALNGTFLGAQGQPVVHFVLHHGYDKVDPMSYFR